LGDELGDADGTARAAMDECGQGERPQDVGWTQRGLADGEGFEKLPNAEEIAQFSDRITQLSTQILSVRRTLTGEETAYIMGGR
jgi:hypothetical protein